MRFRPNGKPTERETDPQRTLLWVLRGDLGLTGAKYGCGEGLCGSCTVVVNGEAVRSCSVPVSAVVPMGAVVANAVFDATGVRSFRLPMTPERVLAGLARAQEEAT